MSPTTILSCCVVLCCVVIPVCGGEDSGRTLLVHWITRTEHSSRSYTRAELAAEDSDRLPPRDVRMTLGDQSMLVHHSLREGGNGDVSTGNRSLTLWNCSKLYDSSYGYNASSCKFVRDNCHSKAHLMNYLAFMTCDLPSSATVCY